MNNRNFIFEQQKLLEQQRAKLAAEAKERAQVRENEAARGMAKAQNANRNTSHLNFINTNQSSQNYNYALQQALRRPGNK